MPAATVDTLVSLVVLKEREGSEIFIKFATFTSSQHKI